MNSLLLIEDNEADACLIRTGFEMAQSDCDLHVVGDGIEAISFLQREGVFAEAPRPKLIILDLNMPRMDGREFLQLVRNDRRFRPVPVIVLSTTERASDVDLCYRLGASAFITKPTDIRQFFNLLKAIDAFWFRFTVVPEWP